MFRLGWGFCEMIRPGRGDRCYVDLYSCVWQDAITSLLAAVMHPYIIIGVSYYILSETHRTVRLNVIGANRIGIYNNR